MNKYYTPSIEEFRVGFEFEYRHQTGPGMTMTLASGEVVLPNSYSTWIKSDDFASCFGDYNMDPTEDIVSNIENGNIRVKYLDKQDIESCRFKEIERSVESVAYSSGAYGEYALIVIRGFDEIMIMRNGFNLFRGKIKNISVFREVLTMIGVEYKSML